METKKWGWVKNASKISIPIERCGLTITVTSGEYVPRRWVMLKDGKIGVGFEEVNLVEEGVRQPSEQTELKVSKFDRIEKLLKEYVPDMLVKHKVVATVEDLISIARTVKMTRADDDLMFENRNKHRNDGTFLSRDQPGVIRKLKRAQTPCDDQSGDNVCADADGFRPWRP